MREISKLHNDQTISNEIADEDRIDDDIFSYAASQGAFEVQQQQSHVSIAGANL